MFCTVHESRTISDKFCGVCRGLWSKPFFFSFLFWFYYLCGSKRKDCNNLLSCLCRYFECGPSVGNMRKDPGLFTTSIEFPAETVLSTPIKVTDTKYINE